jgi:hypothetical protein
MCRGASRVGLLGRRVAVVGGSTDGGSTATATPVFRRVSWCFVERRDDLRRTSLKHGRDRRVVIPRG